MNPLRVTFFRPIICIFLIFISTTVCTSELTTTYSWGGITYNSLSAAESALRNDNFIGSAYFTYQYTSHNGTLRRYDHPPTGNYFEDPKLLFWSLPGIACGDCPLEDQFGNNRCASNNPVTGCASEANWWAGVQNTWPGIDCPLEKTGETAWVQNAIYQTSIPMHLPEEYLILEARYQKTVYAKFPPGNSGVCGREHDFTLLAIAPANCPGGYGYFQFISGTGYQCYVGNSAGMLVFGAKQAEPNSQSCTVGNPCHPSSGDKTLSETDFESDSLPLTRYFHSQQVYPDYAAMGRGWSHSYSGRVIAEESIFASSEKYVGSFRYG